MKTSAENDTFDDGVVKLAHAGAIGGHLGRSKTEEQVRLRTYSPNNASQLRMELRKCEHCAWYKRGNVPKQTPLNPFPARKPFETVSINITRSSRGNEFILTAVDSFSQ